MSETSNVDAEPLIRQTVRTSRILAAAMMMGVSTFLVVALFVVQGQGGGRGLDDPPPGQPAEPVERRGRLRKCRCCRCWRRGFWR